MIKKLIVTLAIVGLVTTAAFAADVKDPKHNPGTTGYYVQAHGRGAPLVSEDFEGGIPAGWVITDNAPGTFTCIWGDLAHCGEAGNWTNGSGNCACISTDICGSGVELDSELITVAYDFSGESELVLAFTANYINLVSTEFFDVDYTTDGGATWNNILSWNEDHGGFRSPPGEDVALDMSGADGAGAVQVRFYNYDTATNDWDWYAQVDDMVIEGAAGDGGGAVPTTTGVGVALMVLILLGSSAYFLRRRATN